MNGKTPCAVLLSIRGHMCESGCEDQPDDPTLRVEPQHSIAEAMWRWGPWAGSLGRELDQRPLVGLLGTEGRRTGRDCGLGFAFIMYAQGTLQSGRGTALGQSSTVSPPHTTSLHSAS